MKSSSGRRRIILATGLLVILVVGGLAAYRFSRPGTPPATADGSEAIATASTGDVTPASTGADKKKEGEEKDKKAAVPVNVAAVAVGPVSSYISATANLVAEDDVKVLAEIDGRIAEVLVEEGARVTRGQPMATLVRDEAEIALNKTRLKVTNTSLARERATRAITQNLMSQQDFDKVQMDDEIARQEKAEAQWRMDRTTIRAPFTGRVTARTVTTGQHVSPTDHLFTVTDFDPLIARIYLPERDIAGLDEGREVRITLKADDTTRCEGRIRQISPVVDPATGTVKLTIEARSPQESLRPGAFVTIDIIRETHERALLVPREAVVRDLSDAYVFIASGDKAEKRAISVGLEEAGQVEALTGLKPGDQVIVAGQGGLKEGQSIKVLTTGEASTNVAASDVIRG